MRIADFFCGAGGFSEGFRQAGFKVVFALDNWAPAIASHEFNHPDSKHHLGDILEIHPDFIDSIVPDTEVIVGSPPCVDFSSSNKAGKADKSLGLKLIHKYLQIVAYKKNKPGSILRYWIMENVPNSGKYVKDSYSFEDLGLPGGDKIALVVKKRNVLNAADYGAPQTRRRFVCGDYPDPKKTNDGSKKWVQMKDVLPKLGSPYDNKARVITDPNYGFSIESKYLTDQFYDTTVEDFEWKQAKRLKEDHGFMGKMDFPERLNRPSRTIMATQSAVSRESIIFKSELGEKYRLPTIREIATLMSFPITYQFLGNSEQVKYKQVGNAVCTKMSKALAKAIATDARVGTKDVPNPHEDLDGMIKRLPFNLNGQPYQKRFPKARKPDAKFRMHVPYLKVRGFRVDLDNHESSFHEGRIVWRTVLHKGSGKAAKKTMVDSKTVERIFNGNRTFAGFRDSLTSFLLVRLPKNSKEFQMRYCRAIDSEALSPEETLSEIKRLVDKFYPMDGEGKNWIKNDGKIDIGNGELPSRILAALYACDVVTERLS